MELRYKKFLKSLVYMGNRGNALNRQFYKKWLKSYSDKGCKEKTFEKKEGFYFIMTNNAIVDQKIYIFQTF